MRRADAFTCYSTVLWIMFLGDYIFRPLNEAGEGKKGLELAGETEHEDKNQ